MAAPALAGYAAAIVRGRAGRDGGAKGRALLAAGAPALAVLCVHVLVNQWRFGTWLRSPYVDQIVAFTSPLYIGVYGFLFSPGGSIFLYAPLLLLLPWTLPGFWRAQRAECAAVLGLALVFLLACSMNEDWTGLYSAPGPRFLVATVPFLMLPLGAWLDRSASRARRAVVAALATAGLAVQIVSAGAHWGNTIEIMQWARFVPPLSFVYIPDKCPLAGGLHALAQGSVDPFLWKLFVGAPGIEPAPVAAVLLFILWAGCIAALVLALRKSLRAAQAD
jgi:hypothetical protein